MRPYAWPGHCSAIADNGKPDMMHLDLPYTLSAGVIALRLQPRALDYAASRLRSLSELQQAANSPLKDVSGSDVKGVSDYLRLERLAQLLAHVRSLKIESALPGLRWAT